MQRIAFLMNLEAGKEEEYKLRHAQIWPEMLNSLRQAGVKNYSIFRHGLQLFAYLEVEDFQFMTQFLAKDQTNAKWQTYMQPLISMEIDPQLNFPPPLPEMFHMD
jgi:L-rhamnose mutarotase